MSAVFSVPTLTNGMVPSFRVGSQCSMSGALTAVDVQGLAGDERGTFEIEDPVDDIADLAGPTDGVQRSARLVGLGAVRRRLDDAQRDGVGSDSPRRILDRQRAGDRGKSALCQCGERGGRLAVGVVDQAGAEIDDVPSPWRSMARTARWVMWKKPARFTAVTAAKSSGVYSSNRLAMKRPALLMRLSMRPKRWVAASTTRCAVSAWVMSPGTVRKPGSSLELIERDVPTTA